jgi:hypothetical protein
VLSSNNDSTLQVQLDPLALVLELGMSRWESYKVVGKLKSRQVRIGILEINDH